MIGGSLLRCHIKNCFKLKSTKQISHVKFTFESPTRRLMIVRKRENKSDRDELQRFRCTVNSPENLILSNPLVQTVHFQYKSQIIRIAPKPNSDDFSQLFVVVSFIHFTVNLFVYLFQNVMRTYVGLSCAELIIHISMYRSKLTNAPKYEIDHF